MKWACEDEEAGSGRSLFSAAMLAVVVVWIVALLWLALWTTPAYGQTATPTPAPVAATESTLSAVATAIATMNQNDQALRDEVNRHFGALRGLSADPTPVVNDRRLQEQDAGVLALSRELFAVVLLLAAVVAVQVASVVLTWHK